MSQLLHQELERFDRSISQVINNSNTSNYNNILPDIVDYNRIHTDDLPEPVHKHYDGKLNLSFLKLARIFFGKLYAYPAKNENQEFYKHLYLLILSYYLNYKQQFTRSYKVVIEHNLYSSQIRLVRYLKHSLFPPDKSLIIVRDSPTRNNNYYYLRKYDKKNTVLIVNESLRAENLLHQISNYNQVFLVGHGSEGQFKISEGNYILEEHILKLVSDFKVPEVFGVLSCGEFIKDKSIIKAFDFYITDYQLSVPVYSEMFINGYFKTYRTTKIVEEAFWAGRIAPILQKRNSPPYRLYEKGTLLF